MTDDDSNKVAARKSSSGANRRQLLEGLGLAGLFAAAPSASEARLARLPAPTPAIATDEALRKNVDTIVVIFAENRSFNNLFAGFPGLQSPLPDVRPNASPSAIATAGRLRPHRDRRQRP